MKKIPRYHTLRILIVSGLFYFFLVMPFMGFMIIKQIPDFIENGFLNTSQFHRDSDGIDINFNFGDDDIEDSINTKPIHDPELKQDLFEIEDTIQHDIDKISINDTSLSILVENVNQEITETKEPRFFGASFDIFFYGMQIILLIGFIFSYPFKRYFRRKRKGKSISIKLEFFCRRYLLYTPAINTALFALVMLGTVGYIAYVNYFEDLSQNINATIFDEYMYIATIAGFLSTLFVFYWQKHRVHLYYLEVLFKDDELRKRIFGKTIGRIRNRLWLASGMTTLLPLVIVVFYLVLSVTSISDLQLSGGDLNVKKVILGGYEDIFTNNEEIENYWYINSVNTYMMFLGIGTSIFVSLIYILTFVRWTTMDIVYPVKELLGKMQNTGEGKTSDFSIVRTNDEIGELAEGYNVMTQQLSNYIEDISQINTSYYRFVPKQFLDFLDKKSVVDIHLGDQVQKEMSVMFSDIRSFTEISENMTPRDNFNFINHYLGYMEPVISQNNGFIDKYIGDAVMALFAETVDDAVNAAIEMRAKLVEFNADTRSKGMPLVNNGIGINTGNLMLGIVGGKGRLEGTVISDHVNLASRLEGLTKEYGASILISQDSLIKLNHPENYQFRFLDTVVVKGKKNSVNVFEILDGEEPEVRDQKIATKQQFNQAQELLKKNDPETALSLFKEIEKESPKDKACKIYIQRCLEQIGNELMRE